jgi:hypothetical protein
MAWVHSARLQNLGNVGNAGMIHTLGKRGVIRYLVVTPYSTYLPSISQIDFGRGHSRLCIVYGGT